MTLFHADLCFLLPISFKNEYLKPDKAIAVMGPTASGKTRIAAELAKLINGEVISADSRQMYNHMPVATAQPGRETLEEVKHHFISVLEPDEQYSAGQFAIDAEKVILDCFERGKVPVIAGGSGLYIRALTDGFYEGDINSPDVRKKIGDMLAEKGSQYLYDLLKKADPETAATTSQEFTRRVFRALEVYMITGRKLSDIKRENRVPAFGTIKVGIFYPRQILYERINERVIQMLDCGLLAEVKSLKEKGFHYSTHNSLNTVGIKEAMMFIEGLHSYDEMIRLIQRNTRRYAKRQLTWLRKEKDLNYILIDDSVVNADNKLELKFIVDSITTLINRS